LLDLQSFNKTEQARGGDSPVVSAIERRYHQHAAEIGSRWITADEQQVRITFELSNDEVTRPLVPVTVSPKTPSRALRLRSVKQD